MGNLTDLRSLDLSYNLLTGPVPVELQNLTNAYRIDIGNNLIGDIDSVENERGTKSAQVVDNNRQIPDELSDLLHMDTLYLGGNKLQFNDIEAIFSWENYSEFKDFIYAPQDSVGINSVIEKNENDNVALSINNYYPGPSDQYQWYKNGVKITGANSALLSLNDLQTDDSGLYICKITNPVATELTLYSKTIKLAVLESVGTKERMNQTFNIYPNPASHRLFIDIQNRTGDLKVYNSTGKMILFKKDLKSQWMDVSHFKKGIYLFKVKTNNAEILKRRVAIN